MAQLTRQFDFARRNDAAYWAAAAILAHLAGDAKRIQLVRNQLRRLGYRVEPLSPLSTSVGETDAC